MRRLLLLLAVACAGGAGVWFALRGVDSANANARVTSLLPRDTLAFLHVADFNRAREQWRETDIYKLWREPAVQDFLQKPLARTPAHEHAEERMQQLERLGMKDAFLAITSWQDNHLTVLGGFRFRSSRADAEKIIGEWRSRVQQAGGDTQTETVQHQRHRIEVVRRGGSTIATVFNDDWFFAANDVAGLTQLLDRTSARAPDPATTLAGEPEFTAALKRMPDSYAAFGFARPEQFVSRLSTRFPPDAAPADRLASLREARSVSATTAFDNGKIRDVLFVAMPKAANPGELKRESLTLTTGETFLYIATLLDFAQLSPATISGPVPSGGWSGALQRWIGGLAQSGVNINDWNAAFGSELSVIGDWPATARIPGLFVALPVKDPQKASEIAMTVTSAATEGSRWAVSERDGVRYHSQLPENPLIPLAPTLGISKERAILGLDASSVEAAMKRATGDGYVQLATTETFKNAEATLPAAGQTFTYVDTALLYGKLDAALRPMLIMSAAFMPSVAQAVDLAKLPPPEVITRHLTPIVLSQSYTNDGYRTESVGPLSIFQAAAGLTVSSIAGATWYRQTIGAPGLAPPALQLPRASPSPAATR